MTIIPLAKPQTRGELRARLRNKGMGHLADRLGNLDPGHDDTPVPRVCGARDEARAIIDAHADVDPPIELDARYVAVITPPFVDQLLQAWPDARFVNLDPSSEEVVAMVQERRKGVGQSSV